MIKTRTDVTIAGGGLAGLGLAYELKKARPALDVTVLDKRRFPVPRAIAKVGESTVEIGSRYLSHHLDLKDHLTHDHLKKFGLRIFFGAPAADFARQDELGASQSFGIPTYQIDRGDLENHLAQRIKQMGVRFLDQAEIEKLDFEDEGGTLQVQTANGYHQLKTCWTLDASGRGALVKKKLQLHKDNAHKANAIWFRVDRRIEIDDWTDDAAWRARCMPEGRRWLSTNHLVGPGYWVWIIPLASGVTSIGIVMDDQAFEDAGIDSEISAMRWLHRYQARCAEAIEGAQFLDFVVLRDYSYSCKSLFSPNGWAITGEAGVFADPLYSPGSDFIGINNGFIRDLVLSETRGEDIRFKSALFERLHFSIYESTLSLYTGEYGGFGDRRMMGLKLLWDYAYYWGVLSLLFFQNALTNIPLMRQLNADLQKAQTLNKQVQARFRARAQQRAVLPARGIFLDQYQIPCLQHFNEVLMKAENLDSQQQLRSNVDKLGRIAASVCDMLQENAKPKASGEERDLLGDYRELVLA